MRPASPSIPSVPLDSASRIAEPAPGVCAGEAVVREEWWWGVSSGWCGGRKGAEMLGYDRAPLEGGSRTRMKRTIVRSRVASGKRCPQSTSGSSGGCHDPDPKSAKNHLRRARRSQPPVAAYLVALEPIALLVLEWGEYFDLKENRIRLTFWWYAANHFQNSVR